MEMGEAAPCLMRSVSQPFFASCEYKEGDPLRALTTSISFGRFMNEPLDWEKWSSFSHNRTLEDVQKYSRPGAVAEKKAFFEAHYKKIAAKKAAISPPNKENKPPNSSSSPQTLPDDPISSTPVTTPVSDDPISDNNKDVSSSQTISDDPISSTPVTSPVSDDPISDNNKDVSSPQTISDDPISSTPVTSPVSDDPISDNNKDVCSPQTRSNNPIPSTPVTNPVSDDPISDNKDVCSPSTNLVEDNMASSCHVAPEKGSPENVSSTEIKGEMLSGQTKPEICSKSSRKAAATPSTRPVIIKAARDVTQKKRSAPQSLHMSMTFPRAGIKNGTTLKNPKDAPNLKVSVNAVKKNSQVLPRTENKSLPEASCTKKPRSSSTTTVASSFSFRSDERAAKRKEFFQKLEEVKGTAKIQLQPKLKARNENKKLRKSSALELKPCTNQTKATTSTKTLQTKVLSSMPKVPPEQTCSPKLGRKPVKDSCCQSSKPKNFIELNKKKLTSSMACLPTKKMHILQRNNVK